jgi:hypothetical protein
MPIINLDLGALVGPQGPEGPIGPEGLQGPEGPDGQEGPSGVQGPRGFQGTTNIGSVINNYNCVPEPQPKVIIKDRIIREYKTIRTTVYRDRYILVEVPVSYTKVPFLRDIQIKTVITKVVKEPSEDIYLSYEKQLRKYINDTHQFYLNQKKKTIKNWSFYTFNMYAIKSNCPWRPEKYKIVDKKVFKELFGWDV